MYQTCPLDSILPQYLWDKFYDSLYGDANQTMHFGMNVFQFSTVCVNILKNITLVHKSVSFITNIDVLLELLLTKYDLCYIYQFFK